MEFEREQVSTSLQDFLSVLADQCNAVVSMVSTGPPIFRPSSPLTTPVIVLSTQILDIYYHPLHVLLLFSSITKSKYLSFFSFYLIYTLWLARMSKSIIRQTLFFHWKPLSLVFWPGLGDLFISQNLRTDPGLCVKIYIYIYIYIYENHEISFQTFFVWGLLLIVHTWNSSPFRSNLLRLQCICGTVLTTSRRLHGSPLVWACQLPSSQPLLSPQLSPNDSLWA